MSATMVQQGGCAHLKQPDMYVALNMATMVTGGFSHAALKETQQLINNLTPKSGKIPCRVLCVLGIKWGRLWCKHTLQWFGNIQPMAAFHATTVPQGMDRCNAIAKVRLNHHQNQRHIRPERHLHHLATEREVKVMKQKVCHPDMCIYILLFPMLNFSIMIHMPSFTSTTKIVCQTCSLRKAHPLISTLSVVW